MNSVKLFLFLSPPSLHQDLMLLETSPARELADIRTVLCAYFPLLFDIAAAFGTLDDRSSSGSSQSGDFLIVIRIDLLCHLAQNVKIWVESTLVIYMFDCAFMRNEENNISQSLSYSFSADLLLNASDTHTLHSHKQAVV
jgi:hypothetical protein